MTKSVELYRELIGMSNDIRHYLRNYPTYENQLQFNQINESCFNTMTALKTVVPRQSLWTKIDGLQVECKKCWAFNFSPRTQSIKGQDIQLGIKFEKKLIEFFNSKGIQCKKGDTARKNFPDNVVVDKDDKIVAYFEVKYLAAPFLLVYKKIPGRECYECSTTLDVGKKIEAQRQIVENEINVPVFYVYWIDFPCIKGIFFMQAEDVYSIIDKVGIQWERKEREGDTEVRQGIKKSVGHRKKIYLPLLEMGNFEKLYNEFSKLSG